MYKIFMNFYLFLFLEFVLENTVTEPHISPLEYKIRGEIKILLSRMTKTCSEPLLTYF